MVRPLCTANTQKLERSSDNRSSINSCKSSSSCSSSRSNRSSTTELAGNLQDNATLLILRRDVRMCKDKHTGFKMPDLR
jgi:hypothetical protein